METESFSGHVTFQGHLEKRGEGQEMNIYKCLLCDIRIL